ncbi:MAG: ATP-binding protein [Rhodospirillaceae bacterium]
MKHGAAACPSPKIQYLCHLLEQVIDLADSGVIILGTGREVVSWNAWMSRHSGVSEEDAIGRTLEQLFADKLAPRLLTAISDCLAHKRSHLLSSSLNRQPLPLRNPSDQTSEGAVIQQAVTVKPILTIHGERHCLIQVADVSQAARRERFLRAQTNELSRLVDELETAKDAANRANVAKSEFLTEMSHELRSPLNAIIGFSNLIERGQTGPLSNEQHEFVTYIRKSGDHLLRMITDILDLSRIEAKKVTLDFVNIDIDYFISESIMSVKGLSHARDIVVSYAPPECTLPTVRADRTRLGQILLNLLANAIKYNRFGGGVIVSSGMPMLNRVRISVSDTGPGIPLERQHELFQSFNRLGAEFGEIEGAGIGLALSRNLANLMGGTVGFESRPGEGSTFWVEMPTSGPAPAPNPIDKDDVAPEIPPLPPFTLLYIEDNPVDRRLIEALFQTVPGARLISARTGEDGLRLARQQQPDVILLDIHLPGISGFKTLKQLRAQAETVEIPVLAVSASAHSTDIANGISAGFHSWLTKPIDLTDLMAVLSSILADTGPFKGIPKDIPEEI